MFILALHKLAGVTCCGDLSGVVQVGYVYLNYFADNFPQFTDPQTVIEKYAPEDAGFLDEIYSEAVLALGTSISGRTLGMPYSVSTPLLYYNAGPLQRSGTDPDNPPATWDEVRAAAEAIKEDWIIWSVFASTYRYL